LSVFVTVGNAISSHKISSIVNNLTSELSEVGPKSSSKRSAKKNI
jgi:hypothetical protein